MALSYYKHIITPLPFQEVAKREDREELMAIRQSLAIWKSTAQYHHRHPARPHHVGCMRCQELRPIVVGQTKDTVVFSSESAY